MFSTPRAALLTTAVMISGVLPTASAIEAESTSIEFFASSSIEQIASQLTGTWMTTDPIEQKSDEDGNLIDVSMVMSIAPVNIEGMDNTLYIESARSDTPWDPFRQAIFQLFEYKGKVRLRTYTMAISDDAKGVFDGITAAPSHFPILSKDQLIATLDIELTTVGSGFSGSTPYPYPTGVGGAVEMTSSVSYDGSTLVTADRGYDANGNVAWGAEEDASFAFERVDPYAVGTEQENGMVVIDYPQSISDMIVEKGDEMHVHYAGYLTNGMMFDSSYPRGMPFTFVYPPGNRAISGWGWGMEGLTLEQHRKLIIPSDLGYGPSGNPRANIPGDSTLIFNIFLAHLERPEPVEPAVDAVDSDDMSHEGHDHD